MKRDLTKNILKGILLIIYLWLINTFIAFVPFSRESNTRLIIITWILIDSAFIYYLNKKKYINRIVIVSAIIFLLAVIGFYFLPINSNFTKEAINLNNQLSQEHQNKYDYAKALFFELEKKYTSPIRQYLLEPWKVVLIKDFKYFWNLKEGSYVDSNIQGRMYRKLLLESKRFSQEEVEIHQSFCTNSPHLLVKIKHPDRETIWADFWAVDNFPRKEVEQKYEFGLRTIRPCDALIGKSYL